MRTKLAFVVMFVSILGFSSAVSAQEKPNGTSSVVLTEKQQKQVAKLDAIIAELEKPRPDDQDNGAVAFAARTTVLEKKREERENLIQRFMRQGADKNPAAKEANKLVDQEIARGDKEEAKSRKDEIKAVKAAEKLNDGADLIGCSSGETQVLTKGLQYRWYRGQQTGITVVNTSSVNWQIRTEWRGQGHVVRDLCSGGSLGLHFSSSQWRGMPWWSPVQFGSPYGGSYNHYRNYEEVLIVAIATVKNGEDKDRTIVKSFPIMLNTQTWSVDRAYLFEIKDDPKPNSGQGVSMVSSSGASSSDPRIFSEGVPTCRTTKRGHTYCYARAGR